MVNESFRERMLQAAREARKEQTPAERALWEMVRDHRCGGLHFRRQKTFGAFRVDFYCASLHLSIEIDGSIHDVAEVRRRDMERQAILEHEPGLSFFRLSNDDVLKHPSQTRQRIIELLQKNVNDRLTPGRTALKLPAPLPVFRGRGAR